MTDAARVVKGHDSKCPMPDKSNCSNEYSAENGRGESVVRNAAAYVECFPEPFNKSPNVWLFCLNITSDLNSSVPISAVKDVEGDNEY